MYILISIGIYFKQWFLFHQAPLNPLKGKLCALFPLGKKRGALLEENDSGIVWMFLLRIIMYFIETKKWNPLFSGFH
ncbi:MAG TPA: hypothetical protein DDX98_02990 [Bacteroidales bacterium]|nr:hypothetical protein [Bacteroidales bacterium]